MSDYSVGKAKDFKSLISLYKENGLEVDDEAPGEEIENWECVDEDGNIIAGASIMYRGGCCVLEGLAVAESLRKTGIGKRLLNLAVEKAEEIEEKELWLCAKVPDYYKQYGWRVVDSEEAPEISGCQKCGQFGVSCFPKIMVRNL